MLHDLHLQQGPTFTPILACSPVSHNGAEAGFTRLCTLQAVALLPKYKKCGALNQSPTSLVLQVGLAQAGAIPLIVQGLKHPDADARECAAAAVGNFAAGNCSFEACDGGEVQILGLVLDAIPSLVKQCTKVKPGPQDDCAGETSPSTPCFSKFRRVWP